MALSCETHSGAEVKQLDFTATDDVLIEYSCPETSDQVLTEGLGEIMIGKSYSALIRCGTSHSLPRKALLQETSRPNPNLSFASRFKRKQLLPCVVRPRLGNCNDLLHEPSVGIKHKKEIDGLGLGVDLECGQIMKQGVQTEK